MGVTRLWLTLCLLICSLSSEAARAIPIPTGHDGASAASDQAATGHMRIAQAQPAQPATSTPAPSPSPTPAASDEPIGSFTVVPYIARELVRRVGGRIWVEANDDGGSVFNVEIPAAAGANLTQTGQLAASRP